MNWRVSIPRSASTPKHVAAKATWKTMFRMRRARHTITARRPILIIAFHSEPEAQGVFDLLAPLGYEHSVIGTDSGSTHAVIGHDLLFVPKVHGPPGP